MVLITCITTILINELLHPYPTAKSLKSADQCLLAVHTSLKVELKMRAACVFNVVVPKLWKSLSLDLRKAPYKQEEK